MDSSFGSCVFHILFFVFILPNHHFNSAAAENNVTNTAHIIKDGQLLVSSNQNFAFGFFGFENTSNRRRYAGIWYNKFSDGQLNVVWVANRDNPLNDTSGIFGIDPFGNIVIYSITQNISLWSTKFAISSTTDASFKLLDTGNLILVDYPQAETQETLWESFDYPSHTLLPHMKIGLNRRTGISWFLTSWKATDDPGTGNFTIKLDTAGYPQIVLYEGNSPRWRAGTWTGRKFNATPEVTYSLIVNQSIVDNADEISYSYAVTVEPTLIRLNLDESGILHQYVSAWEEQDHKWVNKGLAPMRPCDNYNVCGPNSYCGPFDPDEFMCKCLPDFEPKTPSEWLLRNGLNGCIRKNQSTICRSGEGFVKVEVVKVPDTSSARGNNSVSSLEACEESCLKDCNCTAYSAANETSGMGCITWFGNLIDTTTDGIIAQNLFIRVDALELQTQHLNRSTTNNVKRRTEHVVVYVAVPVGVAILLFLSVVCFVLKRRRRNRNKERYDATSLFENSSNTEELDKTSLELPVFYFNTIAKATENFSSENKLGEGGFGSVYKGKLKNGEEIAVKRLAKYSRQGVGEFKNEVKLIAKLQHKNLVRILGYCVQHDEKMLIYEYLPNKSLDFFIFDDTKRASLDWSKRFEIINGIARGILYLHQDSRLKIIHRDLKASNVLLDDDLNPKIADFGMARIIGKDQVEANTNRIVGTYGYMSPEYAMEGLVSVKSDVYSFGVLLLEIITGRKNTIFNNETSSYINMVGHVWEMWQMEKVMELVDSCLVMALAELKFRNEIKRCIQIGLLCLQEDATDRPTMSTIVFMIGNEIDLPSPKKPAFVLQKTGDISNYEAVALDSHNGLTITTLNFR